MYVLKRYFAAITVIVLVSCTQKPVSVVKETPHNSPFTVTVKNGDSLNSIANDNNTEVTILAELNKLKPPYTLHSGQRIKLPKPQYHLVQKGDTLYSLAHAYDVDMASFAEANHLRSPDELTPGQKLIMPNSHEQYSQKFEMTSYNRQEQEDDTNNNEGFIPDTQSRISSAIVRTELPPPPSSAEQQPQKQTIEATESTAEQQIHESESIQETTQPSAEEQISSTEPTPMLKPQSQKSASSDNDVLSKKNLHFAWPVNGEIVSDFGPKDGGLYNDGINISAPFGSPIKASEDGVVVYSGIGLKGYGNLLLLKHSNGYVTAYAHTKSINVQKGQTVTKGQVIGFVGKTGHVSQPQLHFSIRKGRKAINPTSILISDVGYQISDIRKLA